MTANRIFFSVLGEGSAEAAGMLSSRPDHEQERPRSTAHVLARALLASMLADTWGFRRSDVRILAEPSGRPVLGPIGVGRMPFISLSHSRGWVACAASEIGPVGIDIERQRPGRDHAGIAAAAFGPMELARALKSDAAAFYRIWTLREAIAKATGQGLRLATDRHDRVHEGPDEGSWQVQLDEAHWFLSHCLLRSDLNLATALALKGPSQSITVKRWEGW